MILTAFVQFQFQTVMFALTSKLFTFERLMSNVTAQHLTKIRRPVGILTSVVLNYLTPTNAG